MTDTVLGKLYRARLRAQRQIAKLEPQLDGYRAKLIEIEAKIIKLDGLLFLPPRRRVNPYFKPRELPRIAMELLKKADGPVSVSYLATRALAMKGCPYPTAGLRKQTRIRLSHTITAWNKRGLVVKLGRWKSTRHILAERHEAWRTVGVEEDRKRELVHVAPQRIAVKAQNNP